MTRPKINTGAIGSVTVPLPVYQRGKGWSVKPSRVAYHAGETADDARSFAADILSSWQAHHAAWLARVAPEPAPLLASLSCQRCGRGGFRKRGAGLAWHAERCAA